MIKVISEVCLPPRGPGLFLFCCWAGARLEPDWVWLFGVAAGLRIMYWLLACRAVQPINIFREDAPE